MKKLPCSVSKGEPYLIFCLTRQQNCCLATEQIFSQERADVRFEIKRTVSSQMNVWHWIQVEEPERSVTAPLK